MSEEKTSESQRKASRKWEQNNKERNYYLTLRRSARNFIRNHATPEDLEELKELIKIKEEN
ncbi:hypothetical protein [Peptoniphilus asaccharolyticus]